MRTSGPSLRFPPREQFLSIPYPGDVVDAIITGMVLGVVASVLLAAVASVM